MGQYQKVVLTGIDRRLSFGKQTSTNITMKSQTSKCGHRLNHKHEQMNDFRLSCRYIKENTSVRQVWTQFTFALRTCRRLPHTSDTKRKDWNYWNIITLLWPIGQPLNADKANSHVDILPIVAA